MPGALNLKGGISLKKEKKKKKKKKRKHDSDDSSSSKKPRSSSTTTTTTATAAKSSPAFKKVDGQGRLLTSGSTVYGKDTLFFRQVKIGDALLVKHPTSMKEEVRVVKMILSDISISLSSSFSSDLISNQKYSILKRPEMSQEAREAQVQQEAQDKLDKADNVQSAAYGTYGNTNNKVTMRVKSGSAFGGYKLVTVNADKKLSRTDMLNLRCKAKGDRMSMWFVGVGIVGEKIESVATHWAVTSGPRWVWGVYHLRYWE